MDAFLIQSQRIRLYVKNNQYEQLKTLLETIDAEIQTSSVRQSDISDRRRQYYNIDFIEEDEMEESLTPLMISCASGRHQLCRLLLRYGADVRRVSADNASPLNIAASFGFASIVKLLLQYGSALDHVDFCECTALAWATIFHFYDCCKLLLVHGANVNTRDYTGKGLLSAIFTNSYSSDLELKIRLLNLLLDYDVQFIADEMFPVLKTYLRKSSSHRELLEILKHRGLVDAEEILLLTQHDESVDQDFMVM